MKTREIRILAALVLAMVGAGLATSCNWRSDSTQPGPAEEAGIAADQAAETARETKDRMIDKTGEQLEKAGAAMEESGQKMQE
jgi:hypothetical protein